MTGTTFQKSLIGSGLVFVSYVGLCLVQVFAVAPLEAGSANGMTPLVSVVYLPHAVRVLAIVIVGPIAVVPLFVAELVAGIIDGTAAVGVGWTGLALVTSFGPLATLIAYLLVRYLGAFELSFGTAVLQWRPVFLIGILAAALNSGAVFAYFQSMTSPAAHVTLLLRGFAGDILGLVVVALVLAIVLRWQRLRPGN